MKEELYKPSLGENYVPAQSFDLSHIYLIAFIGGVIPLIGIFATNAKRLKVDKKKIDRINAFCVSILIGKLVVLAIFAGSTTDMPQSLIRALYILYGVACWGAASLYRRAMKEPYARYKMAGLPVKPMRLYLFAYMLMAALVEGTLIIPIPLTAWVW